MVKDLGLDDLTKGGARNYLDLRIGDQVMLDVNRITQVKDNEYNLSNVTDKDGDGYKFEIEDEEGDVLSISVWSLWGQIKQAFREGQEIGAVEAPSDLSLKIAHPDRGEYSVEWKTESTDWEKIEKREG